MGSLLCCVFRIFCCDCDCDPADNTNITDEARPGERGAGWVYKRGKSAAVWSRRYFVLTDSKLIYYTGPERGQPKGEIIVAGARAGTSTTRANTKKEYYFYVSHPHCGMRELYVKSKSKLNQWISAINEVASSLSNSSIYGKLYKQGGFGKNAWQERWCICTGRSLDYFEKQADNQLKGSIELLNAKINEISLKDRKFCFEIDGAVPGKKGMKKYVFSVDNEYDRIRWIEFLSKATRLNSSSLLDNTGSSSNNPLQLNIQDEGNSEDDHRDPNNYGEVSTVICTESTICGPLFKQGGRNKDVWQSRWCICEGKTLKYYEKATDDQPKGTIDLLYAKIKEGKWKDRDYVFEIEGAFASKKGMKKYIFSVNSKEDWTTWMKYLQEASFPTTLTRTSSIQGPRESSINVIEDPHEELISGILLKQGGMNKNIWQERWCRCTDHTLTYYESETDKQPKGSIELRQANVRECSLPDRSFGFEIEATLPGKKGMKKYIFSVHRREDLNLWIECLNKASGMNKAERMSIQSIDTNPNDNSVRSHGEKKVLERQKSIEPLRESSVDKNRQTSASTSSSLPKPPVFRGYLYKKSPRVMVGWQKRFFVIHNSGEMHYYSTEEEANSSNKESKGCIIIKELVQMGNGLKNEANPNEFSLHIGPKVYFLKASSQLECQNWKDKIKQWIEYYSA